MKNALTIESGSTEIISEVLPSEFSIELLELGIVPGSMIQKISQAPSGNPIIFDVDGNLLALRKELCDAIIIKEQ